MRIFLRTLLPVPAVFLSPLICLIQAIINSTNPNSSDLFLLIHDMCNARKKAMPALNHSKKTIPRNIFFEIVNRGVADRILMNLYPNYLLKKAYEINLYKTTL